MKYGTVYIERKEGAYMQPARYFHSFDGDVFLLPRDLLLRELSDIPEIWERFSIDGTALIAVELDRMIGGVVAVKDYSLFWIAYFRIWSPITKFLRLFYARLILTLAVWNLAEIEYGEIASLKRALLRRWRRNK